MPSGITGVLLLIVPQIAPPPFPTIAVERTSSATAATRTAVCTVSCPERVNSTPPRNTVGENQRNLYVLWEKQRLGTRKSQQETALPAK